MFPQRVEGIRLFFGDVKVEEPHGNVWHLRLEGKCNLVVVNLRFTTTTGSF